MKEESTDRRKTESGGVEKRIEEKCDSGERTILGRERKAVMVCKVVRDIIGVSQQRSAKGSVCNEWRGKQL